MRAACPDSALQSRTLRMLASIPLTPLFIDGFNLLTTIESALGSGVILGCRDTTFRDIASIHGTYRKVEETLPALRLVAQHLKNAPPCTWYLDSPVSNSGRLKTIILDLAHELHLPWQVELVPNPDPLLAASENTVITADSVILDRCQHWLNLAQQIITTHIPTAWIVNLA